MVKVLATAYISPTPNPEEAAATRAASSPTPLPPTLTVIPSETPFVGVFIGEANQEQQFNQFTEPLFAEAVTVQPTANPDVCSIRIDNPYVPAWRNNPIVSRRMGCPIQDGFGFFGLVQVFETGVMYSFPEINAVWAIVPERNNTGIIQIQGEYEYMENPPQASTIGIDPPPGLFPPGGAFGDMWLAVEALQSELGFARTETQEIPMGLQRFENGTFLLDGSSGQVLALVIDGTMLGPYLAPQISQDAATPTPAVTVTETPTTQP
jgi:hypothetical protein